MYSDGINNENIINAGGLAGRDCQGSEKYEYLFKSQTVKEDGEVVRLCCCYLADEDLTKVACRYLALAWLNEEMLKETGQEIKSTASEMMTNPKPAYAKALVKATEQFYYSKLMQAAQSNPMIEDLFMQLDDSSDSVRLEAAIELVRL